MVGTAPPVARTSVSLSTSRRNQARMPEPLVSWPRSPLKLTPSSQTTQPAP